MQPSPLHDELSREQEAERKAFPLMRYIHFKKVLEEAGIPTKIVIQPQSGKEITIQESDIYDRGTWKKFLSSIHQAVEPYRLTGVGEALAIEYKRWLLTQHTSRYRAISSESHLTWLEQVVTLAVKRFIMENKFEAYLRQQADAFASAHVALVLTMIMVLHDMQKETPRVIHHIVKEPELFKALLREHFDRSEHLLEERLSPLHALFSSLPQGLIRPADQEAEEGEHRGEGANEDGATGEGKRDERD